MSKLEFSDFPHFSSVFVHGKYISNMAACYDNDVNDVTVSRVYVVFFCLWTRNISWCLNSFVAAAIGLIKYEWIN